MKVAIQGIASSFHAEAAHVLFGSTIDLVFCDTFAEVFTHVKNGDADSGVVAIENSLYGSINQTYDLLLQHNLYISAESYQHIALCLMAPASTVIDQITDVYSQAPALSEASDYLQAQLPNAELHEYVDTAKAAELVATQGGSHQAAIASRSAAKEFGLSILAQNIETHHHNYTRFIALTNHAAHKPDEQCKSSIVFQTGDTPGSLYAALGVIAKRGNNLTKLESRPIVGKIWQYMYYVDFEGIFSNELVSELAKHAENVRLLGTYPASTQLPK